MSYQPQIPGALAADLEATDDRLRQTMDNVDEVIYRWGPPIFGPAMCSLAVTSDTYTLVAEIQLLADDDNVPIACRIQWRGTTGHTATCQLEVSDEGETSDVATATNTSSSYSFSTITVTPTSSDTPRVARLWLKTSTAGQIAQITEVLFVYMPSGLPTGVQPSGACKIDGAFCTGDYLDHTVPREVVERAHNTIRGVARSRLAGLAGGLTQVDQGGTPAAGPDYTITGTAWKTCERWLQPGSDEGLRYYMLALKLSGTDPEARMTVGAHVYEAVGVGWHVTVVPIALSEGMACAIFLRSSSGGDAVLETWQVSRAPRPTVYPAVPAMYYSAVDGSYMEVDLADEAPFDGAGLRTLALSCWVRGEPGAEGTVFDISTDGTPRLRAQYSGGDFTLSVADDAGTGNEELIVAEPDYDWHHIFATTRVDAPTYGDEGVELWYDGANSTDGAPYAGAYAVAVSLLRFFARWDGSTALPYTFMANIALFRTFPSPWEIAALAAAGVAHDPRNQTGRWRARKPWAQFVDLAVDNVVPNVGRSTTVSGMTLVGGVEASALDTGSL